MTGVAQLHVDHATLGIDRVRFELAVERVRLGLILALDQCDRAAVSQEIDAIDHRLLALAPGRMARLARRLRLTSGDVDLLWTAVAVCHDPRCASHAATLAAGDYAGGASLGLHALATGLDPAAARRLSMSLTAHHPLVRERILTVRGAVPGRRSFVAPDRVALWLNGDDDIDPELHGVATVLTPPQGVVTSAELERAVGTLTHLLTEDARSLIVLHGVSGVGKRAMIALAADGANRIALSVDACLVAPTVADVDAMAGALARELLLRDRAFAVIANIDALAGDEQTDRTLARHVGRALERLPGAVVVTSRTANVELATTRAVLRSLAPSPPLAARIELWRRALGESGIEAEPIALRYRLGPGEIAAALAAADAHGRGGGRRRANADDVDVGVRSVIAERLSGLATRIEPHHDWHDLVLQPDTFDQVHALVARVRHAHTVLDRWGMRGRLARGAGVAALFSGPPGTGKTMVAGVIARELNLELYQVDLSRVVSKWVGETEKQLAQIFDAAEAGHALLLFDEADALFARRTEVKAAVDRYANLEVNYLLQRVEAFGGVTILTTNMDTAIDPALKRRLAAHVVFWPPEEDERLQLWTRMIADEVPRDGDLDFESLARDYPDMTGANIRNAAVAATFLAAAEASPLSDVHLRRAARSEYSAMGRVLGKRGRE